jgi:hypothetical protein
MDVYKEITEYCIVRHGVDSCSYFPGAVVANTEFTDCATGIGETEQEAFEDALDLLSENGWNVDDVVSPTNFDPDSITDIFSGDLDFDDDTVSDNMSWYVTIKVRGA